MKNAPTCELVEELKIREAVSTISIPPHEPYKILRRDGSVETRTGPAVILIIED